jgi:hypothetical protein
MCKEVREKFSCVEDITAARLSSLPYLNAAIKEGPFLPTLLNIALRMRPPVPCGLQRIVPKSGAFLNGKYVPEKVSSAVVY